jgi:hypothetical protein
MMRRIVSSPFVFAGVASLTIAMACSDDEDDTGDGGKGGSSGSATGGKSSGKGGTSGTGTGGNNTGGTGTGGTGKGGKGGTSTGGSAGRATGGTNAGAGIGGDAGGDQGGTGGVGNDGGVGGEGGEVVMADVLDNPGFEMGDVGVLNPIPGWQESNDLDASYVEWTGGRNNSHKLGHWRAWVMTTAESYTTSTFQTVGPIPNGTYTFSIWINRKWALEEQYLFARGHNAANTSEQVTYAVTVPDEAAYYQISFTGIQVTSGQVTVGIYTRSWGNDWSNIDDASLTKDP